MITAVETCVSVFGADYPGIRTRAPVFRDLNGLRIIVADRARDVLTEPPTVCRVGPDDRADLIVAEPVNMVFTKKEARIVDQVLPCSYLPIDVPARTVVILI